MPRDLTITVVTPSYNQGRYLAQTIESVIGQEGDFEIDYLIVDGGSTDESVEVIRRYQDLLESGKWPVGCRGISYRWLSEWDEGQSDALIKGFALAEGEILAWLNSDDTYLPGALAQALQAFDAEAVGVVYGRSRFIDREGAAVGCYPTEPFDFRRLAAANFICQPSAFFTKKAYAAVGGVDKSLHFAMDYDLWIRLAARFGFRYLSEFLSCYRLHEASKTVSPQDALANHREGLETVRRHYGWQPLNRVYGYCRTRITGLWPGLSPAMTVLVAAPCTLAMYLAANRGVRMADLKMLTAANLRKASRDWLEIHSTMAK